MEIRRSIRLREAEDVAHALGAEEVILWREDNIAFRFNPGLVSRLVELLGRRPRLIFAPFVTDIHPDHVTLNRVLSAALPSADLPHDARVMNYEVWSLTPANMCCDVTDQMPVVEDLLLRYETAMKVDDFVRFCADRNYYNAIVHRNLQGYDEAFYDVPVREYAALLATLTA